jgi:Uma2 family endonuclease
MATTRQMTYADLMAQPDDGDLHELVRGEIRSMPPPKGDHGGIELALAEAIGRYLSERAVALGWRPGAGRRARARLVGYAASGEAGIRFGVPDDPDQVRGADLLYLTAEQFARAEEALPDEYIPFAPALLVEIVSSTDRPQVVQEKVADYLAGGARVVWLLEPRTHSATVYSADGEAQTIPPSGVLDGGEILPGFVVALSDLYL